MARARARQLNATHYVAGGLRAAAGGCIRLGRVERRREQHAAAQAYAHLFPDGATASVVALPDGRYWMVAAQDGAVMSRGDRIHATRESAEQALRELQLQRSALRQVDGDAMLDRLVQTLDAASRLLPVDARWLGLPLPARLCGMGLLLLAAVAQVWSQARGPAAAPAAEPDAAAWQAAFDDWRGSVRVHKQAELQRVMQSLHRVPLFLRGWVLRQVVCAPQGNAWRCAAHFGRALPQATHEALAAAAPEGWSAEFQSLDLSLLRWSVEGDGATLASAPLPRRPARAFLESLQRVSPAFSELRLGPAAPLAAPAPRDAQGQPLPAAARPPSLPGLNTRVISIGGPMRSFGVLALQESAVAWTSFTLHVDAGKPSSLAASVLRGQLQGVLYELR
jgi:hypothetical protein